MGTLVPQKETAFNGRDLIRSDLFTPIDTKE